MKTAHRLVVVTLVVILSISSARAALVESVKSAVAKPALQRIDAFLCEKSVIAQLIKLGVSPDQAHICLTELSDVQLVQLSAQVDKLMTGGDIQSGNPHPLGPVGCFFKSIGDTIAHIFKVLFCWTDVP